jgi:hypothetical protein
MDAGTYRRKSHNHDVKKGLMVVSPVIKAEHKDSALTFYGHSIYQY